MLSPMQTVSQFSFDIFNYACYLILFWIILKQTGTGNVVKVRYVLSAQTNYSKISMTTTFLIYKRVCFCFGEL